MFSSTLGYPCLWRLIALIAFLYCLTPGLLFAQATLRASSQLLGNDAPFHFPERLVVGPQGDVYLLDTNLSSLFVVKAQTGKLNLICGPEKLASPSDLAVDRRGNVWVLSALKSKIYKLNQHCDVQTEIYSRQLPLRIATNSAAQVIVLSGAGSNLFELFETDGKFLGGFGQRIDYKDETTNRELCDGLIVPDRAGGFFFSFNYPPLIRHYGRHGKLLAEFKPESDVAIAPPTVSVRKLGNAMVVRSIYQILVLDMAIDAQGRLYLLLSGQNKTPALTQGTRKLMVLTGNGRVLQKADLDHNFHRLATGNGRLFLLRNRKPLRLDTYAML
jgi:hypothetical protein